MMMRIQIFTIKKFLKKGSNYTCFAVILIDFVLKTWKLVPASVFKSKYIEKEKKMIRYITDDLEIFSDDSDDE